ncbi:hypothetical protein D9M73_252840 [compost metagenome]
MTAVSTKLDARPAAALSVTENPTWTLVDDNQQPLTLLLTPAIPVDATARMRHLGDDAQYTQCKDWAWTSTGPVSLTPSLIGLPNQRQATGTAAGDFTITATCTVIADNTPLKLVFVGTVK